VQHFCVPAQCLGGSPHAGCAQVPDWQDSPDGQTLPQLPQLSLSVCGSTQTLNPLALGQQS
jgi:hypothetical protein